MPWAVWIIPVALVVGVEGFLLYVVFSIYRLTKRDRRAVEDAGRLRSTE